MVLRGSATHPNNLFAAYEATRIAELELKAIEEQLANELRKKQGDDSLANSSQLWVDCAPYLCTIRTDELHRQ